MIIINNHLSGSGQAALGDEWPATHHIVPAIGPQDNQQLDRIAVKHHLCDCPWAGRLSMYNASGQAVGRSVAQ